MSRKAALRASLLHPQIRRNLSLPRSGLPDPMNGLARGASILNMRFVKFALIFCMALAATAADAPKPYNPYVAPASDEAQNAIKRFRVPKGFKVDLFAAEPLLANPVAF